MSNEMMECLPELFGLELGVRKWRDSMTVLDVATVMDSTQTSRPLEQLAPKDSSILIIIQGIWIWPTTTTAE